MAINKDGDVEQPFHHPHDQVVFNATAKVHPYLWGSPEGSRSLSCRSSPTTLQVQVAQGTERKNLIVFGINEHVRRRRGESFFGFANVTFLTLKESRTGERQQRKEAPTERSRHLYRPMELWQYLLDLAALLQSKSLVSSWNFRTLKSPRQINTQLWRCLLFHTRERISVSNYEKASSEILNTDISDQVAQRGLSQSCVASCMQLVTAV